MEDSRIIDLFFERSEQAIIELANKYGKAFMKISMNIVQNTQDAEECVNDAYLGAWNAIPPDRPDPLFAYVCRLLRNISIYRYKYNNACKRKSNYGVCIEELEYCLGTSTAIDDGIEESMLTSYINEFLVLFG